MGITFELARAIGMMEGRLGKKPTRITLGPVYWEELRHEMADRIDGEQISGNITKVLGIPVRKDAHSIGYTLEFNTTEKEVEHARISKTSTPDETALRS